MTWRILVTVSIGVLLVACGNRAEISELKRVNETLTNENRSLKSSLNTAKDQIDHLGQLKKRMDFLADQMRDVKARIETNMGDIEVKFFPEKAPIHCFNFIARAESGYYDNTQFHRIIKGFMIQGGDPNSKDNNPYNDGQGGPLVNIPNEFNDTHHIPGILSMARVADPNAGAGSQFFIMHGTNPGLDGQYTAFGEVTKGMDVVNKIANVATNTSDPRLKDHPVKPVVIKHIAVFR